MGSNAKAHLFYGIDLKRYDETLEAVEDWADESHDDELGIRLGWPQAEWADEKKEPALHDLWLIALRLRSQRLKDYPVKFDQYGEESGGTAWLYIDHENAGCGAEWGEFKHVTGMDTHQFTDQMIEWDKLLKEHCELMGLPYKQPRWLLTATYF